MNYKAIFLSLLLSTPSFADMAATAPKNTADQEIIATLIAFNNNEIFVSDLVPGKTTNKQIEAYAQLIRTDHSKNLEATMDISEDQHLNPLDNKKSAELKAQGQKEVTELALLNEPDFDRKYIKEMVTDHQQALTLIDDLLTKVNNPKLKQHLLTTKTHIEEHLEAAQKIQKQLL